MASRVADVVNQFGGANFSYDEDLRGVLTDFFNLEEPPTPGPSTSRGLLEDRGSDSDLFDDSESVSVGDESDRSSVGDFDGLESDNEEVMHGHGDVDFEESEEMQRLREEELANVRDFKCVCSKKRKVEGRLTQQPACIRQFSDTEILFRREQMAALTGGKILKSSVIFGFD